MLQAQATFSIFLVDVKSIKVLNHHQPIKSYVMLVMTTHGMTVVIHLLEGPKGKLIFK